VGALGRLPDETSNHPKILQPRAAAQALLGFSMSNGAVCGSEPQPSQASPAQSAAAGPEKVRNTLRHPIQCLNDQAGCALVRCSRVAARLYQQRSSRVSLSYAPSPLCLALTAGIHAKSSHLPTRCPHSWLSSARCQGRCRSCSCALSPHWGSPRRNPTHADTLLLFAAAGQL
jgi:hypothetical protein